MKKVKILKLSPDSRYLQILALKQLGQGCKYCTKTFDTDQYYFFIYRFATSVRHREILFQNDGYTSKGTVRLRVDEFGVFYVFVATDWSDRVGNYVLSKNLLVVEIFSVCKLGAQHVKNVCHEATINANTADVLLTDNST